MAIPNLLALALLSSIVFKITKEFFDSRGKSENNPFLSSRGTLNILPTLKHQAGRWTTSARLYSECWNAPNTQRLP
jgi:hypothetical protein